MGTDTTSSWGKGTLASPRFRHAYDETHGDVRISGKYYSFDTDEGLVAGAAISLTCTVDRPATDVWPYFKDHTLWQDAYHHYYSGVLGDLEGKTFGLDTSPEAADAKHRYYVIRVIPEHVIIVEQPVPDDDFSPAPGYPSGGVSPGVMVFMLNEYGGQTVVNIFMEHRFRSRDLTEDEAYAKFYWMPDALIKWRDVFLPALKMLVYDGTVPEEWKEQWRTSEEYEQVREANAALTAGATEK